MCVKLPQDIMGEVNFLVLVAKVRTADQQEQIVLPVRTKHLRGDGNVYGMTMPIRFVIRVLARQGIMLPGFYIVIINSKNINFK